MFGIYSLTDPEANYRPMAIGCFAPTVEKLNSFAIQFNNDNSDIIREVRCSGNDSTRIILRDCTVMDFLPLSENIRGYRFDQVLLYDLMPNELPSFFTLILGEDYLPEEFQKYQYMEYVPD